MKTIEIDPALMKTVAQRVADRCDMLAQHTDQQGCLTRTFCSPAMTTAHDQLRLWMTETSMSCQLDAVGNLIGTLPAGQVDSANRPNAEALMIGSHVDTVVNAGRFDGAMGVLLGLGVADAINAAGVKLPFDLDVAAFSEEEGVRFRFPFIGSRGIIGTFDPADFDRLDADSVTMKQALTDFGCRPEDVALAKRCGDDCERPLLGFIEAHLEQATRLQESNSPVNVVSAIAGQTRATLFLQGISGHAGTVPHGQRRDALAAAAELILEIETLGQTTEGLFATIGSVSARPGLSNVISDQVELMLDLRHERDEVRLQAFKTIQLMLLHLEKQRGVVGSVIREDHSPAVPMDSVMSRHLTVGMDTVGVRAEPMVSGAGHDAMIMAAAVPSCMLFVRCRDGISHHPDEFVSPADIAVALDVMTRAVLRMAETYGQDT